MNHNEYSNPIISIISGSTAGVISYLQTCGFQVSDMFEFAKVLLFAFVGGMVGYLGKIVAERWHKYLIKKTKDICK
jgi:hypothetical protein